MEPAFSRGLTMLKESCNLRKIFPARHAIFHSHAYTDQGKAVGPWLIKQFLKTS